MVAWTPPATWVGGIRAEIGSWARLDATGDLDGWDSTVGAVARLR